MTLPPAHRQLLVRCQVLNREREASERFVEQSLFRLWQYMMANRHGLRVETAEVCLWLPGAEWQAREELFSRVGAALPVSRLHLTLYDAEANLTQTVQRFVATERAAALRERLLGHLAGDGRDLHCDLAQHDGMATLRSDLDDLLQIGYAFEDGAFD